MGVNSICIWKWTRLLDCYFEGYDSLVTSSAEFLFCHRHSYFQCRLHVSLAVNSHYLNLTIGPGVLEGVLCAPALPSAFRSPFACAARFSFHTPLSQGKTAFVCYLLLGMLWNQGTFWFCCASLAKTYTPGPWG